MSREEMWKRIEKVEEAINERDRLKEDVKKLAEEKAGWEEQVVRLQEERDKARQLSMLLETQLKGVSELRDGLRNLIGTDEEVLVKKVLERMPHSQSATETSIDLKHVKTQINISIVKTKLETTTETNEGLLIYMAIKEDLFKEARGAPAIASELRLRGRTIGSTTIYAVLDKLVTAGLLSKKRSGEGLVYFQNPDWKKWVEIVETRV